MVFHFSKTDLLASQQDGLPMWLFITLSITDGIGWFWQPRNPVDGYFEKEGFVNDR